MSGAYVGVFPDGGGENPGGGDKSGISRRPGSIQAKYAGGNLRGAEGGENSPSRIRSYNTAGA
jgi:hypothetical protein